ncbi:hypothetical protein SUFG_00008 [Sulfitobacter phage phiCB2047-B]|uniref:Uncharacterized protein n=1 Tax=Sulfitobacter phage phiCB2047-B TaxID=754046 RepID=M4PRL1_9CAUD|nr:hypothetical protein SUFG_00008 [Sulfitobacter phage phiCB2047-B]AGH07381.1 hypothetical protein SUFG_00008 [Sulfitobacter phage phiCB2047-B]
MTSVTGCGDKINLLGSEGIPDESFKGIKPVYADGSNVGNLTEAYLKNTESLVVVNGRIGVLCEANEIEDCGNK